MMPRVHLVELEDLSWWPAIVRDLATDYLYFIESRFGLHRPVVPLLDQALRATGLRCLVDLCSGGGGPVPSLVADLRTRSLEVSAVLTDLFPNPNAFAQAAAGSAGTITYERAPVDARAVPRRLQGFRTMFMDRGLRVRCAAEILLGIARRIAMMFARGPTPCTGVLCLVATRRMGGP